MNQWTTSVPTKEGYYWAYNFNAYLVYLDWEKMTKVLYPIQECDPWDNWWHANTFTHWLPFVVPEPPTEE